MMDAMSAETSNSAEKKWIPTLRCGDIPPQEGRSFRSGDLELGIFNLGDRFVAIDNACPHMGEPLSEGFLMGNIIVCPLHAWKFSLDTGRITCPADFDACVGTYRTRLEEGIVQVELPAVNDIKS
jgi:nitrite reductase/ring-hydroxylating ferredoxin subunit